MTNCPFRKIISRRSGGVTRTRSRWRQSRRSAAPPDRRARLCLRLSGGWCAKLHSDLGQTGNPSPADGLQLFVTDLMKAGPQQRSDHDYGTRGDWQVDGLSGGSLSLACAFGPLMLGDRVKIFTGSQDRALLISLTSQKNSARTASTSQTLPTACRCAA